MGAQSIPVLPSLAPPHHEIPLTFWERYGVLAIVFGSLALVLIGIGFWLFVRPRKPMASLPAATQARNALDKWRHQAETGRALSEISRILRHYIITVFGLTAGERTTTEFISALADHVAVGPELAQALAVFLNECDRRKFSPVTPTAPLDAAARALELITQAEARLKPPVPGKFQ